MNAPTQFSFHPFRPEQLVESLGIAKDLEEATPELESPNNHIENDLLLAPV
jgi:hypothetical protein